MKNYVAIMLYQSSSDSLDYETLYQETFVEVMAADEKSANTALQELAKRREVSYKNEAGEQITWSLIKIVDRAEVLEETPEENVRELYARHFKDFDAYKKMESLIND